MSNVESPEQSYWPSCKVRLAVRFDEYGLDVVRKAIAPGTKNTKSFRGNPSPRGPLKAIEDLSAPPGVKRFEIAGNAGVASTPSQVGGGTVRGSSPDQLTFRIEGIIPQTAEVDRNSFRKADQCKIDIRFVDLPFDPRVMRSIAVDVFIGTLTEDEYAAGISGAVRPTGNGGQEPLNVIPDTYLDDNGNQRSNLRFEGWADAYEMKFSKEGDQIVSLECRDSTHLLTLIDVPSAGTIDKEKPIDEAIADYLSQFPMLEGLIVEYRPYGPRDAETPPRLGKVLAGTSFQPQLGPAPAKGGASTGGDNMNVWDFLTDIAGAIGHTIRIEGRVIIIQRLRDILNGHSERRPDDPYRTRRLPSRDYENRTMIYGRNVNDLSVRKEFTKKSPTNIEIRCYNARRKKVLVARFPEKGDEQAVIARPGADTNDKKWTVIPVSGIEDEKILKWIAEDVYNSLGRNEVQIDCSTDNLASFGGGNSDPDLLDMLPGDTVEVLVNHDEDYSTANELATKSAIYDRNREMMQFLGFDAETAAGYATAYTNANFQRLYRVRELKLQWSASDGVAIAMQLANYIEARADRVSDDGPQAVSNSPLAKQDAQRKSAGRKNVSSTTILDKPRKIGNPGNPIKVEGSIEFKKS